jgi:hypothetical protein
MQVDAGEQLDSDQDQEPIWSGATAHSTTARVSTPGLQRGSLAFIAP